MNAPELRSAAANMLATCLDGTTVAALVVDPSDHVCWANDVVCTALGVEPATLHGSVVPAPRPDGLTPLRSRAGAVRLFELRRRPLSGPGDLAVGATLVGPDRTDTEQARAAWLHESDELERRIDARNRELEAARDELDAFAHLVSHDLRGPLRTVAGFSEILLDDYAGRLDAEGADMVRRIHAGSLRLTALAGALEAFTRPPAAPAVRETVSLSAIAERALADLRSLHPERAVSCVVRPGLVAHADARAVEVVLTELLSNAWKFTAPRASARIEVGQIEDGAFLGEDVFFVRDDGVGFDMRHADKLFQPLQRLHDTEAFPGSALGLATVMRIVHRMGGRIWAEGEVGRGATFHFTL